MPLLNKDQALSQLAPYFSAFRNAWLLAWSEWKALAPEFRINMTPTTRAGIVQNAAVSHAARLLGRDVRLVDVSKLKVFLFPGNIAIRFKKLDPELASRNVPTQQVLNFRAQMPLPGLHETYNLEAGYVLSQDEQEVSSTYLVCPNGSSQYWSFEVLDTAVESRVVDMFDKPDPEVDVGTTEFLPKSEPDKERGSNVLPFRRKQGDDPSDKS